MPQLHDLPTLQEYYHLMDFSKKHTEKICVSTDFAQLDENEITHLIDFTYFTAPAEYLELYPVLAIDPYRIHLITIFRNCSICKNTKKNEKRFC